MKMWENGGTAPHILEYVIAQVVIHQALTKGAQVQFQASPCVISGGQSGNGEGWYLGTSVSPVSIRPPMLHTKISFIYHIIMS